MQTPTSDAELKLLAIESELKLFKLNYESKQADRLMSNYTWISNVLEEKILLRLKTLKEMLEKIKSEYIVDYKMTKQFDAPIYHCIELYKLVNEIFQLYKTRASFTDLSLKLHHNMPKINDNMSSLKNRFYILKNNLNRGIEMDDGF